MISSIAVCFQNMEEISGHAGACQNYLIYKIRDNIIVEKEVLQLAPEEALHNTFHNPNANPNHPLFKVGCIVNRRYWFRRYKQIKNVSSRYVYSDRN